MHVHMYYCDFGVHPPHFRNTIYTEERMGVGGQGNMPLPRGVDAMFHKFNTYPVQHMLTCTCYNCSGIAN